MAGLLKHLADSMNLPFFVWTPAKGLKRYDLENPVYRTQDPKQAMDHLLHAQFPAIYYFEGLGPFINDPVIQSSLGSIAGNFSRIEGAVIMTGSNIELPDTVRLHSAELEPPEPQREDYENLLNHIIRDIKSRMYIKVDISEQDINQLLNNLNGLTLMEAEKILTKAIIEDRCLSAHDIQKIIKAKISIVERDGLLEYFPFENSLEDIADLTRLKQWLNKRSSIITQPEKAASFGLIFPKGILLLGVPGSGKSLCAKAVAMEWKLPLLKMDPSNLYNKYIGESEKNFKRAVETAEKMSPVVLWIDEIEKAFSSGGDSDSGVSQRVLGMFLSWMQERKGNVFVVATSNDVAKLPPEYLRKGRFDEIFFVDLPDDGTRENIFRIHLEQRGHSHEHFDLCRLAGTTAGFSGAEIEQVIVSALYTSFSDEHPLSTEILMKEAHHTVPLSKTRAEHIEALREWARDRTVSAQ
jgi:AAA+ superfamily predicted ATPase